MFNIEMAHKVLFLLLVLGLVGLHRLDGVAAGNNVQVLDKDKDSVNIESIAKIVCQNQNDLNRQLSRPSTISKLRVYFNSLSGQHELTACKETHFEAIKLLDDIVTRSNENVCSDEKISLIEDFHVKYVSTASEHKSARNNLGTNLAPHKLQMFFWHYAFEVSAICKRGLINNLEWDLKEQFPNQPDLQLGDDATAGSNPIMAMFSGAAGNMLKDYKIGDFDDVVTFWSLIGQSLTGKKLSSTGNNNNNNNGDNEQEETKVMDDTFDPLTGEPVRMMVKMKVVSGINAFKRACYYKYKPIYRKLILPIVRLSDLGYSDAGEQFKRELEELKENKSVRRWYEVTQICDAALPVKFYEDKRLNLGQVVMITREEAETLEAQQEELDLDPNEKQLSYEPTTNSFKGVDTLESVYSDDGLSLIKRLKTSETAHGRIFAKAVKRVLGNAFKALKSKVATVFVSKDSYLQSQQSVSQQTSGVSNSASTISNLEDEDKFALSEQVSDMWANMSEEDLIKMRGSAHRGRNSEAAKGAVKGVGKRVIRRRKGDADMRQEMLSQQLSYQHTKSWGAIVQEWLSMFRAIEPSWTSIVIFGGILTGVMVLFAIASIAILGATVG